ncbi:hypothetical protein CBR_g3577 [Chara braunii]|uniref:DDE Tnp4 domain-containing protein n=1 Tax=Chara braunii TaxID=69332 RepID=A0A388KFR5_CHABU|nr:hypothetical protein CBR_g3577 [Chara braunii]|eukprot:GBG68879.1 hypothetical protein CBR_g3577 [Chara braunii]
MDDEWEGWLLFFVLAVIQWVSQRNVAAMAVLEAAAILPQRDNELAMAMTMLGGVVCHSLSMLSALPHPLFNEIVQQIGPHIQQATTNWRQPLPAEQKFAYALIRWATRGFYRQSNHGVGMRLASALRSNKDVADAIIKEYPNVVAFPEGRRLQNVMDAFERKGFPGCVATIDCTHLYIEKPKKEHVACYYDRTGQFLRRSCAITSAAFLMSLSVVPSWHDIRALKLSTLTSDYDNIVGILHGEPATLRDGSSIDPYLLGDTGYPLLSWIMTPHPTNRSRSPEHVVFDDMYTTARSCIEHTFGFLKAIWRNFGRRHINNLKIICKVFMACCILHNILLDHKVDMNGLTANDNDDSDDDDSDDGRRRSRRAEPPLQEGNAMAEHIVEAYDLELNKAIRKRGSGEVAGLHAREGGGVMEEGKEGEEGVEGEEKEEEGYEGEEEEEEGEEGEEGGETELMSDDDAGSRESSDGFGLLYGEHREDDDDDDPMAMEMETQVVSNLSAERDYYEVQALTSIVDLQHRFNEAPVAANLSKPSGRTDVEEVIDGILGDHHMFEQPSTTPDVDDPRNVKPSAASAIAFSPPNSPILSATFASGGEGGVGARQHVTSPKKSRVDTQALDVLALPVPTSPTKEWRDKPAGKL